MDESSLIWFQCLVDETTRLRLFVPDRVKKSIGNTPGKFFVAIGYRGTPYPIIASLVKIGKRMQCVIEDGWTDFMEQNDIQIGDTLEMYYFGTYYFRVRLIHDGYQVFSDIDEKSEDVAEDNETIRFMDADPPTFKCRFTKHYIKSGRLYVPVEFARENLYGYPPSCDVQILVGCNTWKAVMKIKYDANKNIVKCLIKEGVNSMVTKECFKAGLTVTAEFFGDVKPPLFFLPKPRK